MQPTRGLSSQWVLKQTRGSHLQRVLFSQLQAWRASRAWHHRLAMGLMMHLMVSKFGLVTLELEPQLASELVLGVELEPELEQEVALGLGLDL